MPNQPGALGREIAAILRGRIVRFGLTQSDLAPVVGVDQSQLSKMLRGLRPISLDQLAVLCEKTATTGDTIWREAAHSIARTT